MRENYSQLDKILQVDLKILNEAEKLKSGTIQIDDFIVKLLQFLQEKALHFRGTLLVKMSPRLRKRVDAFIEKLNNFLDDLDTNTSLSYMVDDQPFFDLKFELYPKMNPYKWVRKIGETSIMIDVSGQVELYKEKVEHSIKIDCYSIEDLKDLIIFVESVNSVKG